jgi:hypothetical protein
LKRRFAAEERIIPNLQCYTVKTGYQGQSPWLVKSFLRKRALGIADRDGRACASLSASRPSDVGVLDIALLDGMFGHQFFLLVNHAGTQERMLLQGEHFFPEIFALHKQLSDYRRAAG